MPELSIIVPVYNVEKYLQKCINSIQTQTFTDFEYILIDDGSSDNSGTICDECAVKDSRTIVIHQPNAGVSCARNAGLEIVRGEYIGFVDSDDWIEPDMYETMLDACKSRTYDIVICGFSYFNSYFVKRESSLMASGEYTREELLEQIFGMPNKIGGGTCNKIFRADTISSVRFDRGIAMAEDWLFLFNSLRNCKNGIQLGQPLYCVYERPGSATRNENALIPSKRLLGSSLLLLLLCRDTEPWLEGKATDKYLDDCVRCIPVIRECGITNHQPYRMCIVKIKWQMFICIIKAMRRKLLPVSRLVRYIYLCLKV